MGGCLSKTKMFVLSFFNFFLEASNAMLQGGWDDSLSAPGFQAFLLVFFQVYTGHQSVVQIEIQIGEKQQPIIELLSPTQIETCHD